MCIFVDERILKNEEVSFLNDLTNLYTSVWVEIGGSDYEDTVYTSQKLGEKLNAYYVRKSLMDSGNQRRGNVVFSEKLNAGDAHNQNEVKLQDIAFSLRKSILNSKHSPLPDDISLQYMLKGEIKIPEGLMLFLTHLITGPDSRLGNTERKSQRINSIAQDLSFSATGGLVKPSKHLLLGLAIKKLTSSRKDH